MAAERSLERLGQDRFDVLLLHNPDRTGYESEDVWKGMAALREAGLADAIGVAPGPANGFTLDVVRCFERFGDAIDWAMIILNPFEPWPGELCLDAAARHDVRVITRVVDYGGIFWDDVTPETKLPQGDHRSFRPEGWIAEGRAKLDRLRPIAERSGSLRCSSPASGTSRTTAVECVVPTLIQEAGADARPIEEKRVELAALPAGQSLGPTRSRRSGRSATTRVAWRSRGRPRITPARSGPTAGRSRPSSPPSRASGGSTPSAICVISRRSPPANLSRGAPAPRDRSQMTAVLTAIRRVLVGTGSTAFTLVGALLIGFGVPLFWIFVASKFYGKTGAVNGPVAAFIGTGILVSYYGLLLIASYVRARLLRRQMGHPGRGRQDPWNRSMRDTPYKPGEHQSDPVERLFVTTAIVSMIAFLVWFAFFAGAPFPNSPG